MIGKKLYKGQYTSKEYADEIWKDVPGYEGLYKISSYGRVLSKWGGWKLRKPQKNHNGYLYYDFYNKTNKKRISIHRVVALTFIENTLNKPCINHKDGNPLNNHISNLEWCTISENTLHATHVLHTNKAPDNTGKKLKLTTEQIEKRKQQLFDRGLVKRKPVICLETNEEFESASSASKYLGYKYNYVFYVCNGSKKSAKGYHFKFKYA